MPERGRAKKAYSSLLEANSDVDLHEQFFKRWTVDALARDQIALATSGELLQLLDVVFRRFKKAKRDADFYREQCEALLVQAGEMRERLKAAHNALTAKNKYVSLKSSGSRIDVSPPSQLTESTNICTGSPFGAETMK